MVEAIGNPIWDRQEMIESLKEFVKIYSRRPIQDNTGGMKSCHMFLCWFVAKKLKFEVIIESGVWIGLGTWLFDQLEYDFDLYCIEPRPEFIQYSSRKAQAYYIADITEIDWSFLPKEKRKNTLLFFDDHQNAVKRVRWAKEMGFQHMVFEDNYPHPKGNCYSLKKAFANAGNVGYAGEGPTLGTPDNPYYDPLHPTTQDSEYLREVLEIYDELPPVFQTPLTRWGDAWANYPTNPPLLTQMSEAYQQILWNDTKDYTWMAYAKIK